MFAQDFEERRSMRKAVAIFAAIMMVIASGCSRSAETEKVKSVQAEDQELNAEIAKAKKSSADFIRAFHEQQAGTKDFYVKKPYATPSNGREHIWINVTAEANGVFTGLVSNYPEETKEVKMGDVVFVNVSEISDWRYLNGYKLVGGYTIRYFVDKMSPQQKMSFLKQAGFQL